MDNERRQRQEAAERIEGGMPAHHEEAAGDAAIDREETHMMENPQNKNRAEETGNTGERLEKYIQRRNRRMRRNWAVAAIGLALALVVGWNCVFDGASWFQWIKPVDAYENGPSIEEIVPEQNLMDAGNAQPQMEQPAIQQPASPAQDVPAFIDGGDQSIDAGQGNQQTIYADTPALYDPNSTVAQDEYQNDIHRVIAQEGGIYLQVWHDGTWIYPTSTLRDAAGSINMGIVYGMYYDIETHAVQVAMDSDYGILTGYVYVDDVDWLDRQITMRMLVEGNTSVAWWDQERTIPLSWMNYIPVGTEDRYSGGFDTTPVNMEEAGYNPSAILGAEPAEEPTMSAESILGGQAGTIEGQGTTGMAPEGILTAGGLLENLVATLTQTNEPTLDMTADTQEPVVEGGSILDAGSIMQENTTDEPTETAPPETKTPSTEFVDANSVLANMIPGFAATDVPEQETEPTEDAAGDTSIPTEVPAEETVATPTTEEPIPTDDPATPEQPVVAQNAQGVVNANAVLANLIPGLGDALQTQATLVENTEEPTTTEEPEDTTTEEPLGPQTTEVEVTEESPTTTGEPTQTTEDTADDSIDVNSISEDPAEPTVLPTTDETTDVTDASDDTEPTEEQPAENTFIAQEPDEGAVPSYYTYIGGGIYTFTAADGAVHYRVFGAVNGVAGFYAMDELGAMLNASMPVDLAQDAALLEENMDVQPTTGGTETDAPETETTTVDTTAEPTATSETSSEEPTGTLESTETTEPTGTLEPTEGPATETDPTEQTDEPDTFAFEPVELDPADIPEGYILFGEDGSLYGVDGADGRLHFRVYGTVNGENEGFYACDEAGTLLVPVTRIDPVADMMEEPDQTEEPVTPEPVTFSALTPAEESIPAYYTYMGDGFYTFTNAQGETQYRVYGIATGQSEGFYAMDDLGALLEPVVAIDLEAEALALSGNGEEPDEPVAAVFEATVPAPEVIPAYYELLNEALGLYGFTAPDGETAQCRVHGTVNGENEGFYASDAEGNLVEPAERIDLEAEAASLTPEDEDETQYILTRMDPEAEIVPAYYVYTGEGLYTFTGAESEAHYRVYGQVNGENEGFYATDALGALLKPVVTIDLDAEADMLAGNNGTAAIFDATTPAPEAVPSYYTMADEASGVYSFVGRDEVAYYRVHGTINGENEAFYASDEAGVVSEPVVAINLAEEAETLAPLEAEAYTFEQTAPAADAIPAYYAAVDAQLTLYTFSAFDATEHFRMHGVLNGETEGFFAANAEGVLIAPYEVVDTAADEALLMAPEVFEQTAAAEGTVPGYYAISDDVFELYSFTDRDEVVRYRVHGTVNGENEGFYESDAEGKVGHPATLIDLAWELEALAPVAAEYMFQPTEALEVPEFYLPMEAAEQTLYTFAAYDGTEYIRAHGIVDGQAEGFYACDVEGMLIAPYVPVDVAADAALLAAPMTFVPLAAPGSTPYYYLPMPEYVPTEEFAETEEDAEEQAETAAAPFGALLAADYRAGSYLIASAGVPGAMPPAAVKDAFLHMEPDEIPYYYLPMPEDALGELAIGSLRRAYLVASAAGEGAPVVPETPQAGEVYVFVDKYNVEQYRVYGMVGKNVGWYVSDANGVPVQPYTMVDLNEEIAELTTETPLISGRSLYNFAFSPMSAPLEPDLVPTYYETLTAGTNTVLYGFEGRDRKMYYRVYAIQEGETEPAFYACNRYGENIADEPVDQDDEYFNYAPYLYIGYSYGGALPNSDFVFLQNEGTLIGMPENVYRYPDLDNEYQYRLYGGIQNIRPAVPHAWFRLSNNGKVMYEIEDIHKDADNLWVQGFKEITTLPDTVELPEYYGTAQQMDNEDTIRYRVNVWSFVGRDMKTDYHRVYGVDLSTGVEGFYACDENGNVGHPIEWIDLDEELKTISPMVGGVLPELEPGKALVSAAYMERHDGVKQWSTGTEPFDTAAAVSDNGDDLTADDNVVRSFDTVRYQFRFDMELAEDSGYDKSFQGYKEGKLYVRFELPVSIEQATFDKAAMTWFKDGNVFADPVTGNAVYTGYRLLESGEAPIAVPGSATVEAIVRVLGMANKSEVQPVFYCWLDDGVNDEASATKPEAKKVEEVDKFIVSATPKYNVYIVPQRWQRQGYVDFDEGDVFATGGSGRAYGSLRGFGLAIMVRGDDSGKGLRGVEMPDGGPITFDISFKITRMDNYDDGSSTKTDVTNDPRYQVKLWDYRIAGEVASLDEPRANGTLNRNMLFFDNISYDSFDTTPYLTSDTNVNGMYNPGIMSATEVTDQTMTLTIDKYAINDHFPTYARKDALVAFPSNEGVFSAVSLHVFFPHEEANQLGAITTYQVTAEISNFRATSAHGTTVTEQNDELNNAGEDFDNRATVINAVAPAGSFVKQTRLNQKDRLSITVPNLVVSGGSTGDGHATKGDEFIAATNAVIGDGGNMALRGDAMNTLMKFDGVAFEPTGRTHWYAVMKSASPKSLKVLYAALAEKDGGNWTSDAHLLSTHEEDLVYFESLEDLKAAGNLCVGMLFEHRDSPGWTDGFRSMIFLKVTDEATIGEAYIITSDVKVWGVGVLSANYTYSSPSTMENAPTPLYWRISHHENLGTTGMNQFPNLVYYSKTNYDDEGNIINDGLGNYNGHYGGQTMYINSARQTITKKVAQMVGTKAKQSFDLGYDEREVVYELVPYVGGLMGNKTKATVIDTLPKGLTYVADSAYLGGEYEQGTTSQNGRLTGGQAIPAGTSINVPLANGNGRITSFTETKNGDGTTTLEWVIDGIEAGTLLDKIFYKAEIGDKDDPGNDLDNGASLKNTVLITCDDGIKVETKTPSLNAAKGIETSTSINVVRLADTKLVKTVDKKKVEVLEPFTYTLDVTNNSQGAMRNIDMLDILPFNGDIRMSDFTGSYEIVSIEKVAVNGAAKQADATFDIARYNVGTGIRTADVNASNVNAYANDWTGTLTAANKGSVTALHFKGDLPGYARMQFKITLQPVGNMGGDLYVNNATMRADGIKGMLTSPTVRTQVVTRSISGLAWMDADEDGRRDDDEKLMPGVRVYLEKDGKPIDADLYGTKFGPGGEGYLLTDANGEYAFANLGAGTYNVKFRSNLPDVDLGMYRATKNNPLVSSMLNSDALGVYVSDKLDYAIIRGIEMPSVEEMTLHSHVIVHQDAGFHAAASIKKTSVPGDITDATDKGKLREGGLVHYTLHVNYPEIGMDRVSMTDKVPAGLNVVPGSIWYQLAGQSKVTLSDNAFDVKTGTIIWEEVDLKAGENLFGFTAAVEAVERPANTHPIPAKEYLNKGKMISRYPDVTKETNELTHTVDPRSITLAKTAALVVRDGVLAGEATGSSSAPVMADLGQVVEYRVTLKNYGETSGVITVTDMIPEGMTYVEGSLGSSSGKLVAADTKYVAASDSSKAYVQWTLNGMAAGESAELIFRAKLPLTADDPATPGVVEDVRDFVNIAHAVDHDMRDRVYEEDNGTHKKGDKVWPDEEDWTTDSKETYHRIVEAKPVAVKTSDRQRDGAVIGDPSGETVKPGDVITYYIDLMNYYSEQASNSESTLYGARIRDYIPAGTVYVPGSAKSEHTDKDAQVDLEVHPDDTTGASRLTWTVNKLAKGESVKVSFQVTVLPNPDGPVLIENVALYDEVSPSDNALRDDPPKETNELENPVLWHDKELVNPPQDGFVREGQTLTYQIHVKVPRVNDKSELANPLVTVEDIIPEGTTYVPGSIQIDNIPQSDVDRYADGKITFQENEPLLPGEHVFRFTVVVNKLDEDVFYKTIRNAAVVDDEPTTVVTTEVRTRSASIVKNAHLVDEDGTVLDVDNGGPAIADHVTAKFGQEIEYHLTVAMEGARNVSGGNLVVKDILPDHVTVTDLTIAPEKSSSSITISSANTSTLGEISWTVQNMRVGDTITLKFRVKVKDTLPEGVTIGKIVNKSSIKDSYIESLKYTETVYGPDGKILHQKEENVYTPKEITKESEKTYHKVMPGGTGFDKSVDVGSGGTVSVGDVIEYTLTVVVEDEDEPGAVIEDTLPDGVSFVMGSAYIKLPTDASPQSLADTVYVPADHKLSIPDVDLPIGTTTVQYKVHVDKLPEDQVSLTLNNRAVLITGKGRFEVDEEVIVRSRRATVEKTAALVENPLASGLGGIAPVENGGYDVPVPTEFGQVVEYRITVMNVTDDNLLSGQITVTDQVPEHTTLVPNSWTQNARIHASVSGNTITWQLYNLTANEDVTLTFRVWAPTTVEAGTFSRVFKNQATMIDRQMEEETIKETIRVYDRRNNLVSELVAGSSRYTPEEVTHVTRITQHIVRDSWLEGVKTSDKMNGTGEMGKVVRKDEIITYTITVRNAGEETAEGVRIRDYIPTGTTYVDGSVRLNGAAGGYYNDRDNYVNWDIGEMRPGVSVVVSFQVKVLDPEVAGLTTIVNEALYGKNINLEDPNPDPGTKTNKLKNPTFIETKESDAGEYVVEGEAIRYAVVVTASDDMSDALGVEDILPEGVMLVRDSIKLVNSAGTETFAAADVYSDATHTITWPARMLKKGENRYTYTVVVEKMEGNELERELRNEAQIGDGRTVINIEEAVRRYATIEKEAYLANPDPARLDELGEKMNGTETNPVPTRPGQQVEYVLRVRNHATKGLYSGEIVIEDVIPANSTYLAGSISNPVFSTVADNRASLVSKSDAGGKVRWVITDLAPGQTADVRFRVVAPTPPAGGKVTFINQATLTDKALEGMVYEERILDKDGNVIHESRKPVYTEEEYTKESNKTYHEVKDTNVRVRKSSIPGDGSEVREGQVIAYTITVDVIGGVGRRTVSDVLDEGLTLLPETVGTDTAGVFSYDTATRTLSWDVPSMADGEHTFWFSAIVGRMEGEDLSREISNVVQVTDPEDPEDPEISNKVVHTVKRRYGIVEKTASLVTRYTADGLGGTKATPDAGTHAAPVTTKIGQVVEYILTVRNVGPLEGEQMRVTDVLPEGTTLVPGSITGSGTYDAGTRTITWTMDMQPNTQRRLTFRAWAPETTDLASTPAVYETEREFENFATLYDYDLTQIKYEATFTDAEGVTYQINQTVYSQAEYVQQSDKTHHMAYEPLMSVVKTSDKMRENNPNIQGQLVAEGEVITYKLTVRNTGGKDANDYLVRDYIPDGTTYVEGSASHGGDLYTNADGDKHVSWVIDVPKGGEPIELTFQVTVDELGDEPILIENVGLYDPTPEKPGDPDPKIPPDPPDPEDPSDPPGVTPPVLNPTVIYDKSSEPEDGSEVKEGQAITYTITAKAPKGGVPNVTVEDPLPDGVNFVPGSIKYQPAGGTVRNIPDSAYNRATHTVTWPAVLLLPEGESKFTVEVVVAKLGLDEDGEQILSKELKNHAVIKTPEKELPPTEEVVITVKRRDATITKTATLIVNDTEGLGGNEVGLNPGTATAPVQTGLGQVVEYQITVQNKGELRSGIIQVTDRLPNGTRLVPGSITGGGHETNGTITWLVNGLAIEGEAGDSVVLKFRVWAPETTGRTPDRRFLFKNQAFLTDRDKELTVYEKTSVDKDGNTHYEREEVYSRDETTTPSNETFHEIREMMLTLAKTAVPTGEVKEGQVITYTIRVNVTNADAKGVVIEDILPTGVTLLESTVSPAHASYNKTAGSAEYHRLVWGPTDMAVGTHLFTYKVVVDKLPEGETYRELKNAAAVAELKDPPPSYDPPPKSVVTNVVRTRYAIIEKDAALVENNVVGNRNPGTAENPVMTKPGQTVEYYLTVTNITRAGIASGRLEITDTLPTGTTYVAGSMSTAVADARIRSANFNETTRQLTWIVEGLSATEPDNAITLKFRVTAPEEEQLALTGTRFENQATLRDEELTEIEYETTYTDEEGNTHTSKDNVYKTEETEKDSNKTYNEVQEMISVTVRKEWRGISAESAPAIDITLLSGDQTIDTARLSRTAGWSHTFTNLPRWNRNGTKVAYRVTEKIDSTDTYEAEGTSTTDAGNNLIITITNTLKVTPTTPPPTVTSSPTPSPSPSPTASPTVTPTFPVTAPPTVRPPSGGGGGGGSGGGATATPTAPITTPTGSPPPSTLPPGVTASPNPNVPVGPTAPPRELPDMPTDDRNRTVRREEAYENIEDMETPLGAGENMNLGDCFD